MKIRLFDIKQTAHAKSFRIWRADTESLLLVPLSRITPISIYISFSSASPNHSLWITFSSGPLGVSRFSWLGSHSVYTTPLSTGYKAAQHANMLWHFACCTHLDALFLPQLGHANVPIVEPHPSISQCGDLLSPATLILHERSVKDLSNSLLFLLIFTWVTLKGRKALY